MSDSPMFYYYVRGQSMEPYCKEGDFVLAFPFLFRCPRIGEVVVLKHPNHGNRLIIKRVIRVKKQGEVRYWVEGDNVQESSDSRSFGWVGRHHILGKALIIGA